MVTTDPGLDALLDRVRGGDEAAAAGLVERLHPLVIRIVRSHLPRRAAEEDLAQEVFAKLFARLGRYAPREGIPFDHWVSRLAVRTCLDALRAERRRPEWRWSDLPESQAAWLEYMLVDDGPAPDGDAASAREVVDALLSRLPPEDRLVIRWLDLEQLPVREIAARTGWSGVRVKVRAFRARRKLRALAASLKGMERHE